MELEILLITLIIGAVAGFLAGVIVKGSGFGLVGNIIVGIVGALVAGFLFPQLGIAFGGGMINAIISATLGAVMILVIVGLVRRA